MKNGLIIKRTGAYLIDFLIITLISSSLTYLSFLNPKYDEYTLVSSKYTDTLNDYYDKKIDAEKLSEITMDISYELNKSGYVYLIGDIVIAFLYFGVFAFVTKGQTLGKKIMGIKIVSNKENKELKLYNYFIRTLILNEVILKMTILIAVSFSEKTYLNIYTIGANINTIILIVIFLMIMFTKEGRGLHDVLAGTKVVDTRSIASEEVEVIKPKKEESINE